MLELADVVLAVHLAFVMFVVVGGLLVLRWPILAWLHVPAIAWGAGIEFAGGICPLTRLEQTLLERAGVASYDGGFVEHYLTAILYPSGLTREVQIVLGLVVVAVNVTVYALLIRKRRRDPVDVQKQSATK